MKFQIWRVTFFKSVLPLKNFWDGLPVFAQQTIYHVHTETRQCLASDAAFRISENCLLVAFSMWCLLFREKLSSTTIIAPSKDKIKRRKYFYFVRKLEMSSPHFDSFSTCKCLHRKLMVKYSTKSEITVKSSTRGNRTFRPLDISAPMPFRHQIRLDVA